MVVVVAAIVVLILIEEIKGQHRKNLSLPTNNSNTKDAAAQTNFKMTIQGPDANPSGLPSRIKYSGYLALPHDILLSWTLTVFSCNPTVMLWMPHSVPPAPMCLKFPTSNTCMSPLS